MSARATFTKTRAGASVADFAAEAAGLEWLRDAGAPVPEVIGVDDDPPALRVALIEPGSLTPAGAERLGRALADTHRAGAPAHGQLPPDAPDPILRIGLARLEPAARGRWNEVYAQDLVLPLLAEARERGALDAAGAAAIESVCDRLDQLAGPAEPPARLHGDLWSGNVLGDPRGEGWLIDPAAYGGHREIDLAMLQLFGAPSERIFAAYDEAFPLADGHSERVALWQLLPLLVHAVLFAGSYGRAAADAARRYG